VLLKGEAEAQEEERVRDPAAELSEQEQWGLVREALDALSDKDRDVLLLWDAGQSYTEIAKQTGLAVGAVGTTLARARRRLAEAYQAKSKDDSKVDHGERTDVARR
jgi:RNA polymerase sigma factor (sigma-70 family)